MHNPIAFPDLLRLIDERTAAFIAAVPNDLDAPVPTCPGWTAFDLVEHLGNGRRKWARIVTEGDPEWTPVEAPRDGWQEWMAESTRLLVAALEEAGPDRACWGWWGDSQTPLTVGAAARRQVHEIAVHTYDAQVAAGAPHPVVPAEIAVDGVDEFLMTCFSTSTPWPYEPAVAEYHLDEGGSWRITVNGAGARIGGSGGAGATARGAAHDLLMSLYGRGSLEPLKLEGDVRVFDQFVAWEP